MKINHLYFFYTMILFFVSKNIYADTTSVFCATINRDWEWLKENNKILEINGEWISFEKPATSNSYFYLRYFKINEGKSKIEELQNKCIKNFGPSYIYAQPADSRFSAWTLMGINDQSVAKGTFEIANYCRFCPYKNKSFYLRREFQNDFNNLERYFKEIGRMPSALFDSED